MYEIGSSVYVKTRVGDTFVAFPAKVLNYQAAEGQHGRARFLIQPDNGNGQAWVTEASLFPATNAATTEAPAIA